MRGGERWRWRSMVATVEEIDIDGGGGDQRRMTAYRAAARRPCGGDFRAF
jgi:hypothetical protein